MSQLKNCAWPCIINNSNVNFALIVRNVSIKDTITLVNEVKLTYVGSNKLFDITVCIAMLLYAPY